MSLRVPCPLSLVACCDFASEAYSGTPAGVDQVEMLTGPRDTHGWMGLTPEGVLVIAFRGTASAINGLTDIDCVQVDWDGRGSPSDMKVHLGFLSTYRGVAPQIYSRLTHTGPIEIVTVGHSLGGALATLCALDLSDLDGARSRALASRTFGSPRVGNPEFASTYDAACIDTMRVVHGQDDIPQVPSIQYQHVNPVLHLLSDGTIEHPARAAWLTTFAKDVEQLVEGCPDHRLAGYREACVAYEQHQAGIVAPPLSPYRNPGDSIPQGSPIPTP
jgi:pimeloyl-ACP methyl ester carboxylesterase